jgi:predicted acyltransferase
VKDASNTRGILPDSNVRILPSREAHHRVAEVKHQAQSATSGRSGRVVSIDVIRGLAVLGMLIVNNPGIRRAVPAQLKHAEWNGFTFADSIFPLFLFAIGLSLPFSSTTASFRKVLRRSFVLLLLGIALSSLKRSEIVIGGGVLQRIAVAYLLGWIILRAPRRAQLLVCAGILVAVWAAFAFLHPAGVVPGSWDRETNLAAFIDERTLGHFSTEGVLGTVTSSVNVVGGAFLGTLLRRMRAGWGLVQIWSWVAVSAVLGLLGSLVVPINKSLWTPTYALFAHGICCAYLGIAYWLTDVRGVRAGIKPLQALGANPIAIYVASTATIYLLLDRLRPTLMALVQDWTGPRVATLAYTAAVVGPWWAIAWWLYERKIYIKI